MQCFAARTRVHAVHGLAEGTDGHFEDTRRGLVVLDRAGRQQRVLFDFEKNW